jgi:hypothetical protein
MKRLSIAFAAVALSAFQADATVIATDLFNDPSYKVGVAVYPESNQDIGFGQGIGPNDGTGFTTGWQNPYYTSTRTIVAGLTYPGLATSAYGAQSTAYVPCVYCVNSTAVRDFSDNTATTNLWVSFLIRDDGISAQNFSLYPNYGGFGITVGNDTPLFAGVPGVQPNSTADYSLQTGSQIVESADAAARGQTDLIVMDISDNGNAYLYVDPTVGQALGSPDATIPITFAPSDADGFWWTDSWGWSYSDLRVGTTYTDVTPAGGPTAIPEPAAWAIMLIGLAGVGGALRVRGRALRAAA